MSISKVLGSHSDSDVIFSDCKIYVTLKTLNCLQIWTGVFRDASILNFVSLLHNYTYK